MKYLKYLGWLLAIVALMIITKATVHLVFETSMELLSISSNRATAGGYSMEVVVSSSAFVLILWKIIYAMDAVGNWKDFLAVLKTRTVALTFGIAGLIGMGFTNRLFWWLKHMFTDEAYNQAVYTNAANSVIISTLLCVIVYALRSTDQGEDQLTGALSAIALWGIGFGAFMLGAILYVNQY